MKIPDIKGLVSIARGMLDTRAQKPEAAAPTGSGKVDTVELSNQGQVVQRLAAQRTDETARADMVSRLKLDYESGQLAIDTAATAEEMVADGMFDDLIAK